VNPEPTVAMLGSAILHRRWEFISELPTTVWDGSVTLKGSHSMGDGWIFLKIFAIHSLMTTFRINLIWAGAISLYSTFKATRLNLKSHEPSPHPGTDDTVPQS
jgi:hypothetical protein